MQVLVSAIVPAYNVERYLGEAIQSVLDQSMQNVEAVVVNDGSTDSTGAIADQFAAANPERVRVLHQTNQGFCMSRNAAIAAARGKYLATLDSDDAWLPNHIERCVEVLERQPSVGLVHANTKLVDETGAPLEGPRPRRWRRPELDAYEELLLRRENVLCTTAVWRASITNEIGAFDPKFNRLGCEDRDLWLRMAQVSKLVYLDECHARYRWHGANMSGNPERMLKARRMLVEKHARHRGRRFRYRILSAVESEHARDLWMTTPALPVFKAFVRSIAYDPLRVDAWKGLLRLILIGRQSAQSSG